MKHFTIDNQTSHINVHASARDAEAIPNSERFTSESGLAKITAALPMARLTELWNDIPGVTLIKRFKDRATAAERIWKAIQNLDVPVPTCIAQREEFGVAPEARDLIAEVVILPAQAQTPARNRNARRAVSTAPTPQGADVASEAPALENDATLQDPTPGIDKSECERLLKTAATRQRAYWNALRDLEKAIRFEMDDPGDLENTTVDELLEMRQTNRKVQRQTIVTTSAPRENSKISHVIAMLTRPEGTSVEEIMTAMKWQKHTTRALLSAGGALVKKHGLVITTELVNDARRHYIRS